MNITDIIKHNLEEAQSLLQTFMTKEENIQKINHAAHLIADSIGEKKHIYACGNGGSMCDAMHFAEELSGRFREDRKALPAMAISDPSHLSCVSNDYGYEFVFSRFLEAFAEKGDVLLGISTSGHSKNVLLAAQQAQKLGLKIIALTGKDGGLLKDYCDIEIRAPHAPYADRAQEIHIKIIHSLIHAVEEILFKQTT